MTPRRRLGLLLVLLAGVVGGATALRRVEQVSNADVPAWAIGEFQTDAARYAGRRLLLEAGSVTFVSGVEAPQVLPIEAVTAAASQRRSDGPVLDLHLRDGEAAVQLRVAFVASAQEVRLATMPDVRWRKLGSGAPAPASVAAALQPPSVPPPADAARPTTTTPTRADSVFIVCCVDAAGRPSRSGLPAIYGVPVRHSRAAEAAVGADSTR